jgi:hypothetical protein
VGKVLRILMLAAALAVPAVALAASTSSRVYVSSCTKVFYKPKTITISCGDGADVLKGLKWTSWTATKASGHGTDYVNQCRPDCVSGKIKKTPATITLSKPIKCSSVKHKVFKTARLALSGKKARTVKLGCPTIGGGGFY